MKNILAFTPTFTPAARTLSFAAMTGFDLRNLLAVVNITRNQIIYAQGQPAFGFSAFSAGVLTLAADTTAHNAADTLSCFYDVTAVDLLNTETATTGTIAANGQTVQAETASANAFSIQLDGTHSGINLAFELSHDGTNWTSVSASPTGTSNSSPSTGTLSANSTSIYQGVCGAARFVRVRATSYTSGTLNVRIRSQAVGNPPATIIVPGSGVSLQGANNRAGFIAGAGIWYDDSTTVLAASATFTGTSRDATVSATATGMNNAATYAQEVRLSAESDVAGTLVLEVSRDNTNWRRIKAVATSAVSGGGHYAEIIHRPSWRYWRAAYVNGAAAQARFTLNSLAMAI